jgi:hypothetical protein
MTRTPQIEALPGMTPLGFKPKPKTPSLKTLERWLDQGVCKTPVVCRVEPDGICEHGKRSWLLILGYI